MVIDLESSIIFFATVCLDEVVVFFSVARDGKEGAFLALCLVFMGTADFLSTVCMDFEWVAEIVLAVMGFFTDFVCVWPVIEKAMLIPKSKEV